MASGFIATMVAHDYTCPKGEEIIFKNAPKVNCPSGDSTSVGPLGCALWLVSAAVFCGFMVFVLWLIFGD